MGQSGGKRAAAHRLPALAAALAAACLGAVGCYAPSIGDGQFACGPAGACPVGLRCAADGFCRRGEAPPRDAGAPSDRVADGALDLPLTDGPSEAGPDVITQDPSFSDGPPGPDLSPPDAPGQDVAPPPDQGGDAVCLDPACGPVCPPEPQTPDGCPPSCTGGCVGGRCLIDCGSADRCGNNIIFCPEGLACIVRCNGPEACARTYIDCTDSGPCLVECSGAGACAKVVVQCGLHPCSATCADETELGPLLDCGESCRCASECSGFPGDPF